MDIKGSILDFGSIEYKRELEDRALYPYWDLNYLTGGIVRGTLSVLSADAGAGKTTMSSDIINNILSNGDKVFGLFGEGTIKDQQIKMYRQMTPYGKDNYECVKFKKNGKATNITGFFVDQESERKVKERTSGKLYIYDTKYGMNVKNILDAIDYVHNNYGVNYIVLDNASQIETTTMQETKEVKDAFEMLRKKAIDDFLGILVLAHYRKQQDTDNFRRDMTDIMGTSAISQKASTVMNIIRLDYLDRSTKQFKAFSKLMEMNGWDMEAKTQQGKYAISSVVEVLKSRFGSLGFVALGFNSTTQTYYQIDKIYGEKQNEPILYDNKSKESTNNSKNKFDNMTLDDLDEMPF
jgi:replicative DNA helicase